MVAPKLNRRRALVRSGQDRRDLGLGEDKGAGERRAVCGFRAISVRNVRAGQYWRMENLKSFDEFLEKRFPESRRKAYYLMAIHENLTKIPKHGSGSGLEQGGGDGQGGAQGREGLRLCNLVAQSQ
jgi:hypothetical protein